MNRITEQLCEYALTMRNESLSKEVVDHIKMHVLDYYAAGFSGYEINRDFNRINEEILFDTGGKAESTVLFSDIKLPSFHAAYMNALYAHGADMDDGNSKAAGHISTHVIPAVLALAETVECTWKDVFTAINTGYDFFDIVAGIAQPSLYRKGFHSTGIAGGIACAAACAQILKLDKKQMYNAVSLAAVQSSGLIIIDESGQECKPVNPANAARTGVLSALMALKGVNAPENPLESRKGWFNAFSDIKDLEEYELKKDTIIDCYIKLYPTCRHTHSCIEAAEAIHERLKPEDKILRIDINIYENAIRSAGGIRNPGTPDEAKFSIAYATAIALKNGTFTLQDLRNIDHSDAITDLEAKVNLIADADMIDPSGTQRGCRMTIMTVDGKEYSETVPYPKGERDKKLTWDEFKEKYFRCAKDVVNKSEAEKILNMYMELQLRDSFRPINIYGEKQNEQYG
ncbi:MAG: MmgE/PrpD family protein [Lachnospiraceae bacterium]|nr:MmgE/PrpD family protein [Lachnospiraceae bacterium]